MLEINHITFTYPDGDGIRTILDDISMSLEPGLFYSIVGDSGSGKTTLMTLLSGLESPAKGSLSFNSEQLTGKNTEEYRRKKIGIVFQAYNLITYLTALENVQISMDITENLIESERKEAAYAALMKVGIDKNKANRRVTKLSGGEQQRVAIARALARDVDVLIADEPTGNLDETNTKIIVDLFKQLAHENKKCVIVATHSKELAANSDVLFSIQHGRLIQSE